MPEPFKNEYNPKMIAQMGGHLYRICPEFDKDSFVEAATHDLTKLELKERLIHIADALATFLPSDFEHAVSILHKSLAPYNEDGQFEKGLGITGWGTLPLNHYVSQNGLNHFDVSMNFFKEVTAHFSAEFDIRYFLIDNQERTMGLLHIWGQDPSYHVRRLASEGTRPRLPWAMKLQSFIDNPSPILPLLEVLRDDEEEYVRRSVANNLNDISKDHPDLVASIAKEWLQGADKNRKRLVKHACRTLIKKGHKPTLEALGFGKPEVVLEVLNIKNSKVRFGSALEFEITLRSQSCRTQKLIIDYAVHHRKANGSTSPKVFKWKNTTLQSNGTLSAIKKHSIKPITTRTYYNGAHAVEIFVNGVSLGKKNFELYGV